MIPIEAIEHGYFKRTTISWHLSNTCNFACSYCPQSLHAGNEPWPDIRKAREFVRQIAAHYGHGLGRELVFLFSGGEPTLYPHLLELMDHIGSEVPAPCRVSVISNGARTIRYWQESSSCMDHVILSYHVENDYLDSFIAVARHLSAAGKLVYINLPMHPGRFDASRMAFESMTAAGLPVFLKPLWHWGAGNRLYDYSPEQAEFIRIASSAAPSVRAKRRGRWEETTVERLIADDHLDFKGWICAAGLQHVAVKQGDLIYAAECQATLMGRISEIFTKPPQFSTDFLKCTASRCVCVQDLTLSKFRPAKVALIQ